MRQRKDDEQAGERFDEGAQQQIRIAHMPDGVNFAAPENDEEREGECKDGAREHDLRDGNVLRGDLGRGVVR
jgi:hypothetical protein